MDPVVVCPQPRHCRGEKPIPCMAWSRKEYRRQWRRGCVVGALATFLGFCLFGALLGCSAPPRSEAASDPMRLPGPLAAVPATTAAHAFAPPLLPRLAAALLDEPAQRLPGRVRRLHGPTACEGKDPLPYLLPDPRAPRVGVPWSCWLVSSVCPPEPDVPMFLLMSAREPGVDWPIDAGRWGMPGCWLHVQLDSLVTLPPVTDAAAPRNGRGLLQRTPGRGRVLLQWTPAPGMAGNRLWLQLVVAAPQRSPGGWLASYGLEIEVGS